jgi:hypothetical protein
MPPSSSSITRPWRIWRRGTSAPRPSHAAAVQPGAVPQGPERTPTVRPSSRRVAPPVVLCPQRSAGRGRGAGVSGRSAAAASGKSSSGCCSSIRMPIWRPSRGGARRCRLGMGMSPATSRWSTFSPLPAWIPSVAASRNWRAVLLAIRHPRLCPPSPQDTPEALLSPMPRRLSKPRSNVLRAAPAGLPRRAGGAAQAGDKA